MSARHGDLTADFLADAVPESGYICELDIVYLEEEGVISI